MTTTLASLLRAVCEDPADDDVRMILADWLDDHGDPDRAEFIRLQCAIHNAPLERHNRDMAYRDWDRLRDREAELFKQYPAWVPEVILQDVACAGMAFQLQETPTPEGYVGGVWRRGFIHTVTMPLADWLAHGPAVVRAAPVEAVVTEKRPAPGSDGRFYFDFEIDAIQSLMPHDLPDEVYGSVAALGYRFGMSLEDGEMSFPTREDGIVTLSLALVHRARTRADLPPLP